MKQKRAVFVAGGTGGHINAAITVGERFQMAGMEPLYLSGKRPLDYKLFSKRKVIHLDSHALMNANFIGSIKSIVANLLTFFKVIKIYRECRPEFIFGAGGYVCGPALLAGRILGIPVFILEQNSVMGLTNRLLASFSKKIFTHFKKTIGLNESKKVIVSGNPVRSEIMSMKLNSSSCDRSDGLHLLVFGGSLGATSINALISGLMKEDSEDLISVRHQTGAHEQKNLVLGKNISYKFSPYFEDMQDCYSWADLIICRAGASTLAELRFVQKPCILIPYPAASHNHQQTNAELFAKEVNFPVYVEDVDSLARSGHLRLKNIISEVKRWHGPPAERIEAENSTEIIYREIMNHV